MPAPVRWQPSVNAGKTRPTLSLVLLPAHQLSAPTLAAPGFTLPAEGRLKGDTVICANAEGTDGPQQTVETCVMAGGDVMRDQVRC